MNESPVRMERVDALEGRIAPHDWLFAAERARDIADYWARRVAERPKLFDGRVLLAREARVVEEGGRRILRSLHFETSFSAFDMWRSLGFPEAGAINLFSMAALRGSDGAFLLGEMAAHTASAGQVYFPAGTPDRDDVLADGRVDLDGSARRELAEETSLTAQETTFEPGWVLVHAGRQLGCMKIARGRLPARALAAEIETRIARQSDPEFGRIHVVARADDIEGKEILRFNAAFLRWAFAEEATAGRGASEGPGQPG